MRASAVSMIVFSSVVGHPLSSPKAYHEFHPMGGVCAGAEDDDAQDCDPNSNFVSLRSFAWSEDTRELEVRGSPTGENDVNNKTGPTNNKHIINNIARMKSRRMKTRRMMSRRE
jgi:hypothetical protein